MPAGIVAATNRSRNRAPNSDARGVAVSSFPRKYRYTRYGKRPAWNSLVSMPANRSPKSASALPPPTDHASTETSATRRAVPRDAEPVTAASSASEGSARGGARRRALLGRHRRRDRAMTAVSTSTVRARCAAAGARRDRAERDSARLPDAHPPREAAPDPATAHMTSAACNGACRGTSRGYRYDTVSASRIDRTRERGRRFRWTLFFSVDVYLAVVAPRVRLCVSQYVVSPLAALESSFPTSHTKTSSSLPRRDDRDALHRQPRGERFAQRRDSLLRERFLLVLGKKSARLETNFDDFAAALDERPR